MRLLLGPSRSTLFLASAFLFAACSSVPTVMRDGKKMPVEEAAQLDYSEGEAFFKKKQLSQAFARYRRIVETMPTSKLADNAMLRLAQIYESQKQPQKSVEVLAALVKRYPTGDTIYLALQKLGNSAYQLKNYRLAAEALVKLPPDQIPPKKKDAYIQMTRYSLDRSGMADEKLPWLISIYQFEADPVKREKLQAEIKAGILASNSPVVLERIAANNSRGFPGDQAMVRLSTLSHQQKNYAALQKWSSKFFESFPAHDQTTYMKSLVAAIPTAPRNDVDMSQKVIGVLLPMSGEKSILGKRVWNAIQTALDMSNAAMPSSVPLQFVVEDTGDEVQNNSLGAKKLVDQYKAMVIIGPLTAEGTKLAAEATAPEGVPLISLSSAEKMTDFGEHVFRNSLTKSEQAAFLANFSAQEMGIKRVAVLYPETPYGAEFTNLFSTVFTSLGGQVVGTQSYENDSKDIDQPLRKLVQLLPLESRSREICSEQESQRRQDLLLTGQTIAACYPAKKLPPIVNFEALLVPDGVDMAKQVIPLLPYYDIHGVVVMGPNLWNTPDIISKSSEALMQGTLFSDSLFQNPRHEFSAKFSERYKQLYNEEPGVLEAQAFDTTLLAIHIIRNQNARSRRDFANYLANVRDFTGAQGKLSVAANREVMHELAPYIIDDSKIIELVKP